MTRPSVFSAVPLALEERETPEPPEPKVERESPIVKTSTYLPREVHEVLREIAFHERVKVHDLLVEGIEHVLKTRRHPSFEELKLKSAAG